MHAPGGDWHGKPPKKTDGPLRRNDLRRCGPITRKQELSLLDRYGPETLCHVRLACHLRLPTPRSMMGLVHQRGPYFVRRAVPL